MPRKSRLIKELPRTVMCRKYLFRYMKTVRYLLRRINVSKAIIIAGMQGKSSALAEKKD